MEPLESAGWPAWADHPPEAPGLGAGLGRPPPEPPSLEASLGRPGGRPPPRAARPAARPRPARGPASQVRRLLIFCLRTFDTENTITSTYELRF